LTWKPKLASCPGRDLTSLCPWIQLVCCYAIAQQVSNQHKNGFLLIFQFFQGRYLHIFLADILVFWAFFFFMYSIDRFMTHFSKPGGTFLLSRQQESVSFQRSLKSDLKKP